MASDTPTRTANGFVVFLGSAALFVGVAAFGIGALALNQPCGETLEQKRAAQRLETAARLEKEAQEKLHSIGWVDKAKGVVRAPVSDVLPMVVAELKARKPAPSQVKVEPPLPMPVIDPNATEPPPPALTSAPQGADTVRFAPPAAVGIASTLPAPTPAPSPSVSPAPPAPAPSAVPAPPVLVPSPAPPPATPPVPLPTPPTPATNPTPPPVPPSPAPAAPPVPPEPPKPAAHPAPPTPERPPLINPTETSEPTK